MLAPYSRAIDNIPFIRITIFFTSTPRFWLLPVPSLISGAVKINHHPYRGFEGVNGAQDERRALPSGEVANLNGWFHRKGGQGGCRKCCGQKRVAKFFITGSRSHTAFIFRVKINFFDFPLFHMHHNVNGGSRAFA